MSNLRNNGVFSKQEYVGKTLEEATKYAEEGGFSVRIVEKDGQTYMLTMDLKPSRLNFRVNGGFITDVYGG